jgi:nucleoside-diphosphate-sugar epimerase
MSHLPPSSTVLVTGATGFTGRVLVKRLLDEGHNVRAIARASSRLGDLADADITWFRGEVYDPAVVREAMREVQFVFHIATLYRDGGAPESEHRRVHVDSTRLLAEAAAASPGFRRFVHISTVGVHGHIENPPANETAPFHPGDAYQRTKLEAEQWLHAFAPAHGLSHTVLRPAAIYGPGDKRLLKVFRMALKKRFILLGNGKCLYHLIHVEDLVEIMLRAAVHPAAEGQAFICGNPEAITLEQLGRTVAETLNHPFRVLRLPAGPVFFAAALCEGMCRPFRIPPPLYRRRVAFFTKDRSFDTRKVRQTLGWEPRYSNEEGLRATALACRQSGDL